MDALQDQLEDARSRCEEFALDNQQLAGLVQPVNNIAALLGLIGLLLRGARRVRGPASRHARCV